MLQITCLNQCLHFLLFVGYFVFSLSSSSRPLQLNIGAVLNSPNDVSHFHKIINDVNYEYEGNFIKLNGVAMLVQSNPIDDTLLFCKQLMSQEISAVIIDDRKPSETITFTSSIYNIPIIGLSNRKCIFSDKTLYGSYMRMTPSYSHQADVWIQLLLHFKYECVHLIVSNSINGRDVKNRFIPIADKHNLEIGTIIEYDHNEPDIKHELNLINMKNTSCRIYALYADEHNAKSVLDQIVTLNMSTAGRVWIVSEESLKASNLPIGSIGVQYKYRDQVLEHIDDSVSVISNAMKVLHHQVNFTTPPSNCRNLGQTKWQLGDLVFEYLREQEILMGKTGKVKFDERGDRLNGGYYIVNKQSEYKNGSRASKLAVVGQYYYNGTKMLVTFNNSIVWPGNVTNKPVGYALPNHLRIVTLPEMPFVWALPSKNGNCEANQIPCMIKKRHSFKGQREIVNCCEGYCMDLLQELAKQLNFTYTLYQVEDGVYGSYSFDNETGHHKWSGLLGELYYGHADMIVAALTITPERSLAVDFTKPFKYQGITILQKRQSINRLRHPLTSFLQPFQNSLWVSVFVSVHVVALALYLLDRFSPFGRYKLPNCETITEEDALNLSSAIWFAWGVLFNSGIGEGTPRSFSGRVLGMIWAGFAMIVVASYTANLAAFLVLDRPETALSGINDPRLRNPKESFNYSTVRESSVDMYFRRQVELSPVHKRMTEINFDNAEDAIAAVKSGSLTAFIWDSARLEYEAAKDCELSISGEHFGRSGYAIGLPKNQNHWNDKVTLTLLGLHETGFMEYLDKKWIFLNEMLCEVKTENFPPTLGLKNMAGVFILVGTGILGGVGLIMFEIFYKQHQTRKLKRLELARNAVDKWKEMVENRKILLESMNMTARQRYKERHQVHRRRELRSTSKSVSEDISTSITSSTGTGTLDNCNSIDNPTPIVCTIKKPTFLDIKQTNAPTSTISTFTTTTAHHNIQTFRRIDPSEQHPHANSRIHRPGSKPRLRREFSYEQDEPTAEPSRISGRSRTTHIV